MRVAAVLDKPLKLGPISVEPSVVWQLEHSGAPLTDCLNSAAPRDASPTGKSSALACEVAHPTTSSSKPARITQSRIVFLSFRISRCVEYYSTPVLDHTGLKISKTLRRSGLAADKIQGDKERCATACAHSCTRCFSSSGAITSANGPQASTLPAASSRTSKLTRTVCQPVSSGGSMCSARPKRHQPGTRPIHSG